MNNVMAQDQAAAVKFADALSKYPVEVTVGIGIVIPNFANGCSWGFVTDKNTEYVKILEDIKRNPNMNSYKVKNGYLFTMNMDYLLFVFRKLAGNYVTQRDLEEASKHRQEALVALEKFMKDGNEGRIGIYNLNDSPNITISGVTYKAFCVNIQDLLTLCVRNRYYLNLGGALRTPNEVSKHLVQVISKLPLAPSGNALLIDIKKGRRG